ncbi:aldo/keto reductase [soil metagenome]
MESKALGQTGLVVSRIGLGLAALGRPGYINLGHSADLRGDLDIPLMESRAQAVLDVALESGVRYFDVARSYGRAEAFLAGWLALRKLSPGEVVVGSKWGYTYTAGWRVEAEKHEVKEHSIANLRRQGAESRAILGDHLKLYQIHSATIESGVLDNLDVLKELARLRGEGLKIGLSLSGPRQAETLRKALTIIIEGVRLFDVVQATWNLLEPSISPVLNQAHAAGMGVIVKEALANGRLTARNDDPAFAAKRLALQAEADRQKTTLDALAIASALAQPWADVVLSGAATSEQLRSNLGASAIDWDDEASETLKPLAESPEAYWTTRSRMPWN